MEKPLLAQIITENPVSETLLERDLKKFLDYLKQHRLKITNQRIELVRKILHVGGHFTVEDIIFLFNKQEESISRASLYRVISLMLEAEILIEHHFNQNAKYYENARNYKHHDHLICLNCGYIEEFYNEQIEKLQEKVAHKNSFKLKSHSLNLYGECIQMQKEGKCSKLERSLELKEQER